MTDTPLLSVFIPTRNRAKYAYSAIRSVLATPDARLELVVQDNSESDALLKLVSEAHKDPRLVFRHVPERLFLGENFTQALAACTGEYVTCLGDDDGANPEVLDAALWAKSNQLDLVTSAGCAKYAWPDHKSKYLQAQLAARLELGPFSGKVHPLDVELELKKCLAMGGMLGFTRLAGVYRGIVRRSCLEEVRRKIGTYFPGPSPDLACTIALTSVLKNAVQVDYPLFVPGTSGASSHAIGRADSAELRIENKPQFERRFLECWSPLVPKLHVAASVWAETAVQALTAIRQEDLIRELNLPFVHAHCVAKAPQLTSEIISGLQGALKHNKQSLVLGNTRFALEYARFFGMRLGSLRRNLQSALVPAGDSTVVQGLPDIQAAVLALTQALHAAGRSFREVSDAHAGSEQTQTA